MARLARIVASFAIPVPALAASFDRAHATSSREQLICRDRVLSDLDDQLARSYQTRRAVLSPHGADLLRDSQRSWLRFIATVCSVAVRPDPDFVRDPKSCLQEEYGARLGELAKVGQTFGPFLFNRIDLYATEPTPGAESGHYSGFYVQHVAYPQIDNPRTPQAEAWNRQSVKVVSEDGDCDSHGDYDTDYGVGYASERVISVEWSISYYCHGAAHGGGIVRTQNVVLLPTLRVLTEQDVFGQGNGWPEKLQEMFWGALGDTGWKPPESSEERVRSEMDHIVIQPDRWWFTTEGLKIDFSSYEGGCYACTPTLLPCLGRT